MTQPAVASCGLDRFLRVHDVNSGKLTHKVRVCLCVCVWLCVRAAWGLVDPEGGSGCRKLTSPQLRRFDQKTDKKKIKKNCFKNCRLTCVCVRVCVCMCVFRA